MTEGNGSQRIDILKDATIAAIQQIEHADVETVARRIFEADCTILAGNGGSHALASHIAADITKVTKGRCLAVCPADSLPGLTAWSNDDSYYNALVNLMTPYLLNFKKPFLFGISTSGKSQNVLNFLFTGAMILTNTGDVIAHKHRETSLREVRIITKDVRIA